MPDLRCNPLSSGDALFLYLEREGQPLNIAAICEFEGSIELESCVAHIESKLPLIPRYRQRIISPPFDIGLPTWEFDPAFDIRNHLHEVTLKRGTDAEFKAFVGSVLSTSFSRRHPLWDFTLVHGLKDNRTGMIIRIHHCLADGISGVGLMNIILDSSPLPPPLPKERPQFQAPPLRTPSIAEGIISTWLTSLERALAIQGDLVEMARQMIATQLHPPKEPVISGAPDSGEHNDLSPFDDWTRLIPEFGSPTDRLPFNVVCTGPQKFNWASVSLAEIKAVKDECGATVNDVVLALYAAAVRKYADLHGQKLAGRVVRVIVPVNLRGNGEITELGNRITFLPVNIPLDIPDPRKLVKAVKEAVRRARSARMAELIGLIGTLVEAVPTPLQALLLPMVSRLPLSVCNTICTNVPGPKTPLYLLGHKMLTCYPYVPIGGEMGMNCAVFSYNGYVYFGFSGDAHAIPDLRYMDRFLKASFAELKKEAGVRAKRKSQPRTKVPHRTSRNTKPDEFSAVEDSGSTAAVPEPLKAAAPAA